MYHILYNPLSGSGKGGERVQSLRELLRDKELNFCDIREIRRMRWSLRAATAR